MSPRRTTLLLAILGAMLVLLGVRAALVETSFADVVLRLAVIVCGVLWCQADAVRRGTPQPGIVPFLMVFALPVALPVYLVGSRGWLRGIAVTLAVAVAFAILVGVPYATAEAWAGNAASGR